MSGWTIALLVVAVTIFLGSRGAFARFFGGPTDPKDSSARTESRGERAMVSGISHDGSGSDDEGEETTPKADPTRKADTIPMLALDGSKSDLIDAEPVLKTPSLESFPKPPAKGTMPPPPVPSTAKPRQTPMPQRQAAPQSLAPAPSRLSPAAQARQSLAPSLAPTSSTMNNARGKVILQPGHSPLDWAALSRSKNLAGVQGLQRVTPSMLKSHHGRKGVPAWSSYRGKVYNISPYLPFHPGGEGQLMRAAGKDGTKLFEEAHAWVNWDNMMSSCVVGIMVAENDVQGLDDLD